MAPFRVLYGFEPSLPLDRALVDVKDCKVQAAAELLQQHHDLIDHVCVRLHHTNESMVVSANKHRRDVEFDIGSQLYVSSSHIPLPEGHCLKLISC